MVSAIGAEANVVFGEARKSGRRESGATYAADALVALVTGTGVTPAAASSGTSRPTTTMHLRVDLADHYQIGFENDGPDSASGTTT